MIKQAVRCCRRCGVAGSEREARCCWAGILSEIKKMAHSNLFSRFMCPPPTCVNSNLNLSQLVSPAKLVFRLSLSFNFLIEGLLEIIIYLSKVDRSA